MWEEGGRKIAGDKRGDTGTVLEMRSQKSAPASFINFFHLVGRERDRENSRFRRRDSDIHFHFDLEFKSPPPFFFNTKNWKEIKPGSKLIPR